MKERFFYFFCVLFLLFFSSCKVTKFVPEGEYLLDRVEIQTENRQVKTEELDRFVRQTPNSSVFGIWRMQLRLYSLARKENPRFFGRVFQRMGEAPVIYDPIQTYLSEQSLTRAMENKGFMQAEVTSRVEMDRQRARVTYFVRENEPYRVRNYLVDVPNPILEQIATDSLNSLIRPNMLFDVDVLDAERTRVSRSFREQGHYWFNREMLMFEVDSALNSHQVDVRMMLRDFDSERNDSIQQIIFTQYHIRNIRFFTSSNIGVSGVGFRRNADNHQTIRQGNHTLVSDGDKFLRINTLIENTAIESGSLFSDHAVQRTYAFLNALPPIRYVNISFREAGTDSLDCLITIAPAKLVTLSSEAEFTFTDGFWGVATNLGIVHRNVFRGAESLSLQGRAAYERQGEGILAHELGAQVGLLFPNFLMPFTTSSFRRNVRANTEFNASMLSQNRPGEFSVMQLRTGMRYNWTHSRFRHTFEPFDISYVDFNITPDFWTNFIENNRFNRHNYEDLLITRIGYIGSYSSFAPNRPLRNHFHLRYSVETAGNALFALNNLFGGNKNADGFFTVAGNIPYTQYVRADFGITYHQIFDANNRFVYRLFVGAGTPFGNANVIPFQRRYFSGGANSLRGWAESMLGPGVYRRDMTIPGRDYNQVGDIKLDLNFEYRYTMFGNLQNALFLDAGNVWTARSYEMQRGGEFRLNTFWQQLGISYGTGFRYDLSFVVLRVDFGVKLYDPGLPRSESWRTNLTRRDWALHFAIGYPF